MPNIPSGTVTFIFTDIEGSTGLWENSPELMQRSFARQEALLRETFAARGGYVYKMIGDAFQVAFAAAPVALAAAIEAQRRLQSEAWVGAPIRVRMALHTGVTEERGDDYVGPVLNRVARLMAAGHGGQILLSQAAFELVRDELPAGVELVDAGTHRLKDLIRPEHIYQVTAPGLAAQFPPLKTLDAYPHNLPIQLTSFVGREKEMAEVKRLFAQEPPGGRAAPEAAHLVTLTGPGGTGKTRLSLHVAAELLENFPNGVWFVELAPLTDPALVPQTVAAVLGVRDAGGRSVQAALVDYLRPKRLLLVLDNCEHLVEACARLADALLRSCPSLCILASSRELLGIAGEVPYRVPSLATPDTHHLPPVETLPQFDAVRLFIERAVTASPRFSVTNSNAPAIAEICHRLDGIPLAIELVAARVAMLSVEQITMRLDNSFRLLTGGSRTAMPRHQTLRALIDWSYDMLPAPEQVLLHRLSVFMGGWDLEAAEWVCSDRQMRGPAASAAERVCADTPPSSIIDPLDILELVGQLVNKSLVQVERSNGETRYRLLETIRQYAREKLPAGSEAPVRSRHMTFYLKQADQPEEVLRGPDQAAWVERFETDLDNLRAALEWAMKTDIEAGLRAVASLLWFWHIRGYGGEGLEWLERFLAAGAQAGHQDPSYCIARARALNAAGFMHCSYDGGDRAGMSLLEESLALLRPLDSRDKAVQRETANALLNLGRFAAISRDHPTARAYFEQALSLFREVGARFGAAESLNELGVLETIEGNQAEAARRLVECLALRRSIGDQDGIGFILATLSEFAFLQGDLARAKRLIEESLETFQRARNRIFIGMGLDFLSLVTWLMGDFDGAARLYETYNDSGGRSLQPYRQGDLLIHKGNIALAQGHYEAATQYLSEGQALGQQYGFDGFVTLALLGLGRVAWSQGDIPLARQRLQEALRAGQLYEIKGGMGHGYCALARVALSQGEVDRVLSCIQQALPLFQMPFYHWAVVTGLEILIALAVHQEQHEQAARIYGAAERLSRLTRHFHSPAEHEQLEASLSKAREALGPAAFERIKSEGSALSLEQAAAIML